MTGFDPHGASPTGPAGGALSGTYPNPSLAAGAASANVGALGGVLSGTLPNPAFATGQPIARRDRGLTTFGLKAWSSNPLGNTQVNAVTSQLVWYAMGAIGLFAGDVITNVVMNISTAAVGAGPTGIFVGLYDSAFNRLAQSANLTASGVWLATGYCVAPLSAPFTITADGGYYAAFVINGVFAGVQPIFTGPNTSGTNNTAIGAGPPIVGQQAGQATLPAAGVLATGNRAPWFGLS